MTNNDYYILTEEESKLVHEIFSCDQGTKLLKLWEDKHLNRMIADPMESSNMAFFRQGQHDALKNIAIAYTLSNNESLPNELKD